MRVGDRVIVHAHWSTFYKQRGVVESVSPHLMIKLDGDLFAMRFGNGEVSRDESTPTWVAGE